MFSRSAKRAQKSRLKLPVILEVGCLLQTEYLCENKENLAYVIYLRYDLAATMLQKAVEVSED